MAATTEITTSKLARLQQSFDNRASAEDRAKAQKLLISDKFSKLAETKDQEETDRYWNAIVGNGGKESDCGWCKDKWGVSWQITPRTLSEGLAAGGAESKRTFDAMMTMQKIDVAAIDAARKG